MQSTQWRRAGGFVLADYTPLWGERRDISPLVEAQYRRTDVTPLALRPLALISFHFTLTPLCAVDETA